jgi:hypothetical protein
VRPYPQPTAFLLSMFETASCRESPIEFVDEEATRLTVRRPEIFSLRSMGEITAFLAEKEVSDPTFEGVIIRDDADRRFKIKSRTYLAAQHAGGPGNLFNPSRLVPLVLAGEIDEVVAYNPEIRPVVEGVKADLEAAWERLRLVWEQYWRLEDQKSFARAIAGATPFTGLLFALRKDRGPHQSEAQLRQLWERSGDLIAKMLYERATR